MAVVMDLGACHGSYVLFQQGKLPVERDCQAHGSRCEKIADIFCTFIVIGVFYFQQGEHCHNADRPDQQRVQDRQLEFSL